MGVAVIGGVDLLVVVRSEMSLVSLFLNHVRSAPVETRVNIVGRHFLPLETEVRINRDKETLEPATNIVSQY